MLGAEEAADDSQARYAERYIVISKGTLLSDSGRAPFATLFLLRHENTSKKPIFGTLRAGASGRWTATPPPAQLEHLKREMEEIRQRLEEVKRSQQKGKPSLTSRIKKKRKL